MIYELKQIIDFVSNLIGKEQIIETPTHYILPTICHNEYSETASNKLYLYKNPETVPLFTCYTDCGDTFNIYTFIQRYHETRGRKINFLESYRIFHGRDYRKGNKKKEKQDISLPAFIDPSQVFLPEYNHGILDLFKSSSLNPWAIEGVDLKTLEFFKIGYSKSYEAVIIPHFDWRGRLIGVRQRTTNNSTMQYAKYMPLKVENILYSHPLSMNLFGLFQNQEHIATTKTVFLAEGEKSVLQADTMFENNNVLAVCGSSISKWQKDILIHYLNVDRIVVAFDKEYSNWEERCEYIERMRKTVGYLTHFAEVYLMIDDEGDFREKESPFDRTVKEFYEMKYVQL